MHGTLLIRFYLFPKEVGKSINEDVLLLMVATYVNFCEPNHVNSFNCPKVTNNYPHTLPVQLFHIATIYINLHRTALDWMQNRRFIRTEQSDSFVVCMGTSCCEWKLQQVLCVLPDFFGLVVVSHFGTLFVFVGLSLPGAYRNRLNIWRFGFWKRLCCGSSLLFIIWHVQRYLTD